MPEPVTMAFAEDLWGALKAVADIKHLQHMPNLGSQLQACKLRAAPDESKTPTDAPIWKPATPFTKGLEGTDVH